MGNLTLVNSKDIYDVMDCESINLNNLTNYDKNLMMVLHELSLNELDNYELTQDDKKMIFDIHRKKLGDDYDFNWQRMFKANQKDKNGSYFKITSDYIDANPKGLSNIDEDILIVTKKTPGVVIRHSIVDSPVIVMEDVKQKVIALAYCSRDLIDKKMPMMITDTLCKSYNSKDEDIIAYVSAYTDNNMRYDEYPIWATDNKLWESTITDDENESFCINLRKTILKEIESRNIRNILFDRSTVATIQNFVGAFYKQKVMEKRKY